MKDKVCTRYTFRRTRTRAKAVAGFQHRVVVGERAQVEVAEELVTELDLSEERGLRVRLYGQLRAIARPSVWTLRNAYRKRERKASVGHRDSPVRYFGTLQTIQNLQRVGWSCMDMSSIESNR